MPLTATAAGVARALVAPASVQYVNAGLPVLPAVTAAAVMSTVEGLHTPAGFVITSTGGVFTVTVTGLMSVQLAPLVPLI